MDADDDDLPAAVGGSPIRNLLGLAPDGCRDQSGPFRPDVDDGGTVVGSDQAEELVGSDAVQGRHGASFYQGGRDASACRLMG